ncbi:hypothetical protein CJ030_MR4G020902 [Morella rubra]|uniref:Uncharacterized protein n=1 Tax=Morella rubra TaxID=262757 RepID=A0A6A1VWV2_9ROSI|nr:hypothetical protein CJ030_MR4G020902 [Morella rubra]
MDRPREKTIKGVRGTRIRAHVWLPTGWPAGARLRPNKPPRGEETNHTACTNRISPPESKFGEKGSGRVEACGASQADMLAPERHRSWRQMRRRPFMVVVAARDLQTSQNLPEHSIEKESQLTAEREGVIGEFGWKAEQSRGRREGPKRLPLSEETVEEE